MIVNLHIENFRSLRNASLELGRFTVLTGANNSGKSSVLYALQVLRNMVKNPNRPADELFNLGFLNLGGIHEATFLMNKHSYLSLKITTQKRKTEILYGVSFDKVFGNKILIGGKGKFNFNNSLLVSFPYSINKSISIEVDAPGYGIKDFTWNGFKAISWGFQTKIDEKSKINFLLDQEIELPIDLLACTDIIPTLRGFTKPIFNQIPLNGTIQTEDEVATHLAIDKNLQAKVSHYFEKITGKRFSVLMGPGGGFFYLQVREPDSPFTTELVNQGMGVNQILFLLAKILYDKNRLIGIDEPEIHLHPSLIEKFISVLVEIAEKEDKQFVFSTHSEHWLMSLLAEVNDGHLKADDLKVYYLYREGPETKIESQKVADNGQLEGGLRNFLEAEMRLTQRFLD